MFLLTPEIAWHETLPIYSCDLQPISELRKWLQESINSTETKARTPFAELPVTDPVISNLHKEANSVTPDGDSGEEKTIWSRLATSGGDSVIRLWRVELNYVPSSEQKDGSKSFLKGFTFISSLKKHDKPVNVVRWSNSGRYLASGSDDSSILIWMQRPFEGGVPPSSDSGEEEIKELWTPIKILRRHLEDVFDISWSPDDKHLMSGSVDCSVIIWNDLNLEQNENVGLQSHKDATVMRDAKHYVQGVSWDPFGNYFATLSCDRHLRLYSISQKNLTNQISKSLNKVSLFQDDSWKSFFRRLSFSPDGLLLIAPSGYIESAKFAGAMDPKGEHKNDEEVPAGPTKSPQHAAHLFLRSKLTEPVVSYPTGVHPVICVRFCNQPFTLRSSSTQPSDKLNKLIDLPYRWVFCLVLEDGLLLCDTQYTVPFAFVSSIHYQALNDASWADNGRLLVTCSTDGYCSLIYFAQEEIGIPYTHGEIGMACIRINTGVPQGPSDSFLLNDSLRNADNSEMMESDATAALATDNSDLQISVNNSISGTRKTEKSGEFSIPKENAVPRPVFKKNDETNIEISNVDIKQQKRRISLITLPE